MQSPSTCIPLGSFSNVLSKRSVKATFTLTVFELSLFVGKMVVSPAQWGTGSERVNKCFLK